MSLRRTPAAYFLSIPTELRLLVYQIHFWDAKLQQSISGNYEVRSYTHGKTWPPEANPYLLAILCVNRSIQAEALPVFYDHVVLTFNEFRPDQTPDMSPLVRRHLPYIQRLKMGFVGAPALRSLQLPSLKLLVLDDARRATEPCTKESIRAQLKRAISMEECVTQIDLDSLEWLSMLLIDPNRKFDVAVSVVKKFFSYSSVPSTSFSTFQQLHYRSIDSGEVVDGIPYPWGQNVVLP